MSSKISFLRNINPVFETCLTVGVTLTELYFMVNFTSCFVWVSHSKGRSGRRLEKVMMSFILCTLHQILLGLSKQG